ncbi:hypothetical protein [Cyclobacterium sp.]|uniref:hypothetical protein n=1 Tax=Cyclobacterium sp. TaxID=1966343 RepID=UPI0019C6D348|nr:hypothetical protein [Cyclobacterium sp.]MBD3627614.1 hypothetical protein [Cyclobacterium sp.]
MERTSLITLIMVADADLSPDIYLEDDIPDTVSLDTHFELCPFLPERAELTESSEETDQGYLISFRVDTNTPRDEYFHSRYFFRPLLIYIETLNGERHYLGSEEHPCRMEYRRQSAPGISDSNDNTLVFTCTLPKTA